MAQAPGLNFKRIAAALSAERMDLIRLGYGIIKTGKAVENGLRWDYSGIQPVS